MSLQHGAIWWSELMTRDVPGAVKFYGNVCGWTFDAMPSEGSDYRVAIAHGRPIAGIMDMTGIPRFDDLPAHWFTYIAVDNVDRAAEQTRFAGGQILRAPYDVPEVGRVTIVSDAGGAAVGLMTPVFRSDELVAGDATAEAYDDIDEDNYPV